MSEAIQDYLKAIYKLQTGAGKVSTSALAEYLEVAPPSATGMISRLAEYGLLRHDRYHGVELTEAGARAALEVIRHHRLWELFLAEALRVPIERLHEEAERLEHVLSDDLEEHIDRVLGHPTVDPHGDPIPSKDGTMRPSSRQTLADLEVGIQARVARIPDSDPALLRYLSELGLLPGAQVAIVRNDAFGGLVHVDVVEESGTSGATEPRIIGLVLAKRIFVEFTEETKPPTE